MNDLHAGRLVGDGRYRLERQIGEGGMGIVWLAVNTETEAQVALKFLTAERAMRPGTRDRLRREARALATIQHPNVVQLLDVIEEEGAVAVLVMEYLVGETLADRLDRAGRQTLADTATLLLPVVSAVGTAHAQGIVHRDLKPENIFLVHAPDGTIEPHVLDFGLAKIIKLNDVDVTKSVGDTKTGEILGSPYYMSPEQAFGERGIDALTDVWAMGVIVYQCLTARVPFEGENFGQFFRNVLAGKMEPLAALRPDLPKELTRVVGRMLQTDRRKRLGSLVELHDVFQRHTTVEAMTFSTPRPVAPSEPDVELGKTLPLAPPDLARAPTIVAPVPAAPAPGPVSARPPLAIGVGVVLGVVIAAIAWRAYYRTPSPVPASVTQTVEKLTESAPPPAPTVTAQSVAPAPSESSATPASPSVARAVPTAKRAAAPPALSAAATPSVSASNKKLQGGIAGDVPF